MRGWSREKIVCCLELSGCRKQPNHFTQKWVQADKTLSQCMVRAISWVTSTLFLTPGCTKGAHRIIGASEVVKAGEGIARNNIHHL